MAIGIELLRRGHRVTVASSAVYAEKVRSEGLEFLALRPDVSSIDGERLAQMMDARRGTERVIRFVAEAAREGYEDTLPAAQRADVVLTHPLVFGSILAVQKAGVPWVSSVLAPASMGSAFDPVVLPAAPWLVKLQRLGPGLARTLTGLGKRHTRPWVEAVEKLRRELGMETGAHPLFEGQHSPRLVLALFSRCLGRPQADWPRGTVVTGFPFYDRHHEQEGMPAEVERFLAEGPAPLIFSLGTAAVGAAGDFYTESLEVARRLGLRAVYLTGKHPQGLPADAMAVEYAPHSELFPRAAAIVFHGGVGTAAQAMRCGRPMLVTPLSHDQFDNADRLKRLGIAEVLYRSRYHAPSAEPLLRGLLNDSRYRCAGAAIAAQVQAEDGVNTAADAILRAAAQ